MGIYHRLASDDFDAVLVAEVFDEFGIRIVSVVGPTPRDTAWHVFGQCEARVSIEKIDRAIGEKLAASKATERFIRGGQAAEQD
jgi:hypothetical protein